MKYRDKKYIFDNIGKKSVKELAEELKLEEFVINELIEKERTGDMDTSMKPLHYNLIALGVIFFIAFIMRIYPVLQYPEMQNYGMGPFSDSLLYHRIAYNLCVGNGFSGSDDGRSYGLGVQDTFLAYKPAITRGPVYPSFLCGVYKLFGKTEQIVSPLVWKKNWGKVRVTQCVLDAIVCILVFYIVRTIYPESFMPALASALIYAFSFYNIYYAKALLAESVTTFILTCAVLFFLLGMRQGKMFWWPISGIWFGLTLLSRFEYVFFLFFLIALLVFVDRRKLAGAAKKSALFLAGVLIVIAPWTVRNYAVFKKVIPAYTGSLGFNMYVGTFESSNYWVGWGQFPDDIFSSAREKETVVSLYRAHDKLVQGGDILAKELDDVFMKMALLKIRKHPFESLKMWTTRIPGLWYQNYTYIYRDPEPSGAFFIFYFIFFLYAFLSARGNARILMAPLFFLFFYLTLLFLPLHVEPLYGVVSMPLIISLTGIGIWKVVQVIGRVTGLKDIFRVS